MEEEVKTIQLQVPPIRASLKLDVPSSKSSSTLSLTERKSIVPKQQLTSSIHNIKTTKQSGSFQKEVKKSFVMHATREQVFHEPEQSNLEKYMARIANEDNAFRRCAEMKIKEDNYYNIDYQKYKYKLERDQIRGSMVLGEWYDDINSSNDSDDLKELVGKVDDSTSEFLNEIKTEEMSITELVQHIKQEVKQVIVEKNKKKNLIQESTHQKVQLDLKMKLSKLSDLANLKKQELVDLDFQLYKITVEMQGNGYSYSEIKESMKNNDDVLHNKIYCYQKLLKLMIEIKNNLPEFELQVSKSKKTLMKYSNMKEELETGRNQLEKINENLSSTLQQGLDEVNELAKITAICENLKDEQQKMLEELKDNKYQLQTWKLQEDIQQLQEKISYIQSKETKNLTIVLIPKLKLLYQTFTIKLDTILAKLQILKIKMTNLGYQVETLNIQKSQQIQNEQLLQHEEKLKNLESENYDGEEIIRLLKDYNSLFRELSNVKNRLLQDIENVQTRIRESQLKLELEKQKRQIEVAKEPVRQKRLSFSNMVNIRSFQQNSNESPRSSIASPKDEYTRLLELSMLQKKKTSELILKIREENQSINNRSEQIKLQNRLINTYKEFFSSRQQ